MNVEKQAALVHFQETSASPFPPPRKGALRPFLSVENKFEKTLGFRALARRSGSKQFVEIADDQIRLPAGESIFRCWEFDAQVEEVVLYDFALVPDFAE